ncbi:MAG: hypothetical protein JOZ23_17775 [Mycobacterium sp.]|nr:hypothetical protein [Mycobacterium sp.]
MERIAVSLKTLVTGVAAVAAAGAAAAGVTFIASSEPAASRLQPVVFSAPLPLDQTANLPTADQLTTVLNNLADPSVPFANKSGLVEGGIPAGQAHLADHEINKAAKNGELPLTFNVSNIQPAGANGASAAVAISGPKLQPPVTENLTFLNQGSWMLSHDSAMMLVQAVSGD